MSEWQTYSLEEITEPVKETYYPTGSDDIAYIGLEHIEQETLRLNSIGQSIDVSSNKFKFKTNDILFGKLRPYFRKVVRPNFDGICSTDIWVFRGKKNVNQDFLFYFLANWDFVNTANGADTGTRMPRADWSFLKSTMWEIPTPIEQKIIGEVLACLDAKIDLLHRQNKTLEEMAETLFRQWFVEEADEDWAEKSLYDSIELIGGGTPKTSNEEYWNGSLVWLSAGDVTNNHKGFVISSEKSITELGLKNSSAKLLPRYSTVISARGTVGKYCLLSEPMTFSQSNYGVTPKYKSCFFFTYLLVAHSVEQLLAAAYGSVFDTITTNTFKEQMMPLPPADYIERFEIEVTPFFKKIFNNTKQIQTLAQLRDTLLPKLMCGEVKISES